MLIKTGGELVVVLMVVVMIVVVVVVVWWWYHFNCVPFPGLTSSIRLARMFL